MAAHDPTDDGRTEPRTDTCDSCGADGSRHTEHVGSRPIEVCDSCGGDWFRPTGGRDALRTDDGADRSDDGADDDDRTETEKLEALRDWLDRGAPRSDDDDGPRTDRAMDPEPVHAAIDDGRVHYSDGTDDGWLRINRSALVDTEGSR